MSRGFPRLGRFIFAECVAGAYLLVFAPVAMIVLISFFAQEIVSFPANGLTLHWYANAWARPEFSRGLLTSVQVAMATTAIGVPLGVAAAIPLVRSRFPAKAGINVLLLAPLALPGVVTGAGIYMMYVAAENVLDTDIKGTMVGLVAAHTMLTIPWTVRLVVASLQGLDEAIEEAAANLGAGPFTVFRRITLPMMRPGIVAAAMFSFIQSFENLDLTLLLVGPGRITLPVAMLNYLEFRMDPTLAAVATAQIVLVGALMLVTDRFVKLSRIV
ncbi:ABC transporter permease [Bradyrhizobium manausense]|uniref:ABC transporter permease n=1 Tax=Bradyrhizobium manausense TaxID=989370 RepID=UPI001BA595D4|nr:ABC transporter permease [Bradyrhizobium manausense]